MKLVGIYLIRRLSDGMCYVGQSVDIIRRLKDHQRLSKEYIDHAIQKHGVDAFVFEILELCDESNLNQREIHWIASIDSIAPNGFNLTYGGKSGRHSDETRRKISEAHKGKKHHQWGKPHSPETRRKIGESSKGNQYAKGYRHTPETRQKLSEIHKGKVISLKTRRKMSESRKGKKRSPEHCQKLSEASKGEKNPRFGKPVTLETRVAKYRRRKRVNDPHLCNLHCSRTIVPKRALLAHDPTMGIRHHWRI